MSQYYGFKDSYYSSIKKGKVAKYSQKETALILAKPLGNAPKNKKHSFFC